MSGAIVDEPEYELGEYYYEQARTRHRRREPDSLVGRSTSDILSADALSEMQHNLGEIIDVKADFIVVRFLHDGETEERILERSRSNALKQPLEVGEVLIASTLFRILDPDGELTDDKSYQQLQLHRMEAFRQAEAQQRLKPLRQLSANGQKIHDD